MDRVVQYAVVANMIRTFNPNFFFLDRESILRSI